jgi:hypothetical protein
MLVSVGGWAQISGSGTLGVIIPCVDGIVLAIDSRMLSKSDTNTLFRCDSIFKTHTLNEYPILCAGRIYHNCSSITKLFSDFNRAVNKSDNIEKIFREFSRFLFSKWPVSPGGDSNMLMGAYYKNGIPNLFYASKDTIRFDNNVLMRTGKEFEYCFPPNYSELTSDSIINLIPKAFDDYVHCMNKGLEIGGPITIIKINPLNQIFWVKNGFRNQDQSNDLLLDIVEHKRNNYKLIAKYEHEVLTKIQVNAMKCQ